jgi:glucose/arabinose dehydrogenase
VAALVAIAAGVVGIATRESSQALSPKFLTVDRVARLKEPVYLTQPPGPGGQLYVVQRHGTVRVVSADRLLARPFLKIGDLIQPGASGGEQGLTSIAFPADYARSGVFYVAYTNRRNEFVVAEFRRSAGNPLVADRSSRRVVLTIPEPTPDRHGALIAFGPDGYLYVGAGDGGTASAAQNLASLRGKLLRIDPRSGGAYSIPSRNPFVAKAGRDEIWAYGLGDPRRFSFDRPTGTIAIADVGNERFEEIDFLPLADSRGANFGWPAYDGLAPFRGGVSASQAVPPAIAYPRRRACAVIGGYVVRDPRLARIKGPELLGRFLYGDRCSGRLFAFRPRPGEAPGKLRRFRFQFRHLVSLAEDNENRIYVLTEKGPRRHGKPTLGSVYRLVPNRKEVSG